MWKGISGHKTSNGNLTDELALMLQRMEEFCLKKPMGHCGTQSVVQRKERRD
jgi:hypothetical protein